MKDHSNPERLTLRTEHGTTTVAMQDATLTDHDGHIRSESTALAPDGSIHRTVFVADESGPLSIEFHVTANGGSTTVTVYDLVKRSAQVTA
jgi:hypothetical protein